MEEIIKKIEIARKILWIEENVKRGLGENYLMYLHEELIIRKKKKKYVLYAVFKNKEKIPLFERENKETLEEIRLHLELLRLLYVLNLL